MRKLYHMRVSFDEILKILISDNYNEGDRISYSRSFAIFL
jgi:hypothetical protein